MVIDFLGPFLVPLIVGAIACGFYTSAVAESKGHDGVFWSIGGFFFGPLALLAAVGLSDLKSRKYLRLLAEHQGALSPHIPSSLTGGDEDAAHSSAESLVTKPASLRESLDEAGF